VRRLPLEEYKSLFQYNHNYQRYFLPPLVIKVKEHTAQLTNETGKIYQQQFMNGNINVLSSSTTFEMGVDVGNLKAVLLRNVPPTPSSYIQRAGRAGRRKDGVSLALTFCRNVPHDQFHYQYPKKIILGQVPSPYLNIDNIPLAQRHCNSVLMGYFLRSINDIESKILDKLTIENFFLNSLGSSTLVERYLEWLTNNENRLAMIKTLKVVIPESNSLTPEMAIDQSIKTLYHDENSILHKNVERMIQQLENQKKDIERQRKTATSAMKFNLAKNLYSIERLIKQFKEDRLINFLSSSSWLPGYAFPQDIVKLLVRQPDFSKRMRLERDREIGISEYSPGAEIVADGYLFTSGGIWYNSREPDIRQYARCPQCRKLDTYSETVRAIRECSRCKTRLTGKFLPRFYIRPDGFTTLVKDKPKLPGRSRKRGAPTSEVFLLEGAGLENFESHSIHGISYAIKEGGRLFLANSGFKFNGYYICRRCGRGFLQEHNNTTHETAWGTQCSGTIKRMDLAHEIVTDILQLRFADCSPPAPPIADNRPFWLSFVSAFLNGASDALDIDIGDLGATYQGWTEESFIGELVIYDRIPGGAGHIQRILNDLENVLNATLKRVQDCHCKDLEASCYACLRNYNNQFYWDELKRRPVIEWLSRILES